ncbi:ABC transporter ATP-binding protein [Paenibacillus sp. CGMCC 1.16610]|uniref:ATP-binding cassette domain-containing protein n=1 Tax=Paenibacillus anseongense TaxID=2682845 RepID=A0ABW9U0M5_9BACL|nr:MULTISPECIES: ABC transporter ATP-binding protein [Paenibacillus]MBA2943062.1 ABC transporter ATP-binding protein [Paenibacillus sp. CGMCC 1.16610]MVQ33558.1 ATP-binding cassette domain-containing protein [Paenibacillus anseongense]
MTYPLTVENVSKQYGEKTAVNAIHLRVQEGEIYGLLGANGAGKTTTMRMVLGLIYPDQGHILWKGKGYREELKRLMGYLPEERGLYPKIKVSEQILYLAELRGLSRKQAEAELKAWLDRFDVPEYYNKRVEELSKGNQQKIQFIAAVIHNPDILILDEAFSGLDPVNVELLKKTVKSLRDEGKTILFSSHRMEHVEELCEHICILHRSNTILQGSLKEIKSAFPKEKIILQTERPVEGLEQLQGVTAVEKQMNGYQIRIDSTADPQQILQHAIEQSAIHRFQIMEPTLNEIFIQKVGNAHE